MRLARKNRLLDKIEKREKIDLLLKKEEGRKEGREKERKKDLYPNAEGNGYHRSSRGDVQHGQRQRAVLRVYIRDIHAEETSRFTF